MATEKKKYEPPQLYTKSVSEALLRVEHARGVVMAEIDSLRAHIDVRMTGEHADARVMGALINVQNLGQWLLNLAITLHIEEINEQEQRGG